MSELIEKKKSIHKQVYQLIKKGIIEGDYPPNERLYEAKLARAFRVSRSPVREAIRTLEKEGLIEQDHQSRIFVYNPNVADVQQIYQCRQVLESFAISLAAEHATTKELEGVLEIAIQSEQAINDEDLESKMRLIHLNSSFHDAIIQCSRNHRLQQQLNDLRTLTFFYRRMNIDDPTRRIEIVSQHIEIAKVLQLRKKEKAASLMHSHIHTDMLYLMRFLERNESSMTK